MGLFKGTEEQYHGLNSFTATSNQTNFTLDFPTLPTSSSLFNVYLTGTHGGVTSTTRALLSTFGGAAITSYNATTGVLVLPAMAVNTVVEVIITNPDLGNLINSMVFLPSEENSSVEETLDVLVDLNRINLMQKLYF